MLWYEYKIIAKLGLQGGITIGTPSVPRQAGRFPAFEDAFVLYVAAQSHAHVT